MSETKTDAEEVRATQRAQWGQIIAEQQASDSVRIASNIWPRAHCS